MIKKHKNLFLLWLTILMVLSTSITVSATPGAAKKPQKAYVILHHSNGKIYKKLPVKNGVCKLPGTKNPRGYTFLGWSPQKNQSKNPRYLADQKIVVKKTMKLYPVFFNRRKEVDLDPWELLSVQDTPYSKVIFVGDSRTFKMQATFKRQCDSDFMENLEFVCKSGMGLNWFKTEGYSILKQKVAQARLESEEPIAIIFNLGVNDLRCSSGHVPDCSRILKEYISYFNRIGQNLSARNCKLFYMSVNPANPCMLRYAKRRNEDLRAFNSGLQKKLSRRFTYLDTYSKLMKYGYSTNNDVFDDKVDDGLHYSMATYKRIYRMCMEQICRSR